MKHAEEVVEPRRCFLHLLLCLGEHDADGVRELREPGSVLSIGGLAQMRMICVL
ncbi:MAG: hypothetical protein ACYCV5_13325 [Acidimicrobiales bacterium]